MQNAENQEVATSTSNVIENYNGVTGLTLLEASGLGEVGRKKKMTLSFNIFYEKGKGTGTDCPVFFAPLGKDKVEVNEAYGALIFEQEIELKEEAKEIERNNIARIQNSVIESHLYFLIRAGKQEPSEIRLSHEANASMFNDLEVRKYSPNDFPDPLRVYLQSNKLVLLCNNFATRK